MVIPTSGLNQSAPSAPSLPDSAIPTAHDWKTMGTMQACYTTADGHIHELFRRSDRNAEWAHADLTQMAKAPIADPLWTLTFTCLESSGADSASSVQQGDQFGSSWLSMVGRPIPTDRFHDQRRPHPRVLQP